MRCVNNSTFSLKNDSRKDMSQRKELSGVKTIKAAISVHKDKLWHSLTWNSIIHPIVTSYLEKDPLLFAFQINTFVSIHIFFFVTGSFQFSWHKKFRRQKFQKDSVYTWKKTTKLTLNGGRVRILLQISYP